MTILCDNCFTENSDEHQFCSNCGQKFESRCTECKTVYKEGDKFCTKCGTAIVREKLDVGLYKHLPETPSADRRQITVLCCDMVDSTKKAVQLDPEDFRIILRQYQKTSTEIIEQHSGYITRYMGDAVLAYFGYPQAQEDDAERAILAALQITDAINKLGIKLNHPLSVRVGVTTGKVIVGEQIGSGAAREVDAVGLAPHLATRLQTYAKNNSVVISDSTAILCGHYFNLRSLGIKQIKGMSESVAIWQVLSKKKNIIRFKASRTQKMTPFYGREAEVDIFKSEWNSFLQSKGCCVFLSGEAGIGKSRLTEYFYQEIADKESSITTFQSHPYNQNSTLFQFNEQLKKMCGITGEEDTENQLSHLQLFIDQLIPDSKVPLMYELLASLLGIELESRNQLLKISPLKQQKITISILCQIFLNHFSHKKIIYTFEDIHWMDDISLLLLSDLIKATENTNVFIIVTFRSNIVNLPEVTSNTKFMSLSKLNNDVSSEIIQLLSKGKLTSEDIKEINRVADGIPLYIEELIKCIDNANDRTDLNKYDLKKTVNIPSSLQDALMSRLDRNELTKPLLNMAAVIGREFNVNILKPALKYSDEKFYELLEQVIAEDLIYKVPEHENLYCFNHALIQETAYQSLLKKQRFKLHSCVANVLIKTSNNAVVIPEVIAKHFHAAEDFSSAAFYWNAAAKVDLNRSAITQAISHLKRALSVLNNYCGSSGDKQLQFECESMLAPLLMVANGPGHHDVVESYQRAIVIGNKISSSESIFPLEYGECLYYWAHGELFNAKQLASVLQIKADQTTNDEYLMAANTIVALVSWHIGDNKKAYNNLNKVIELYDENEHAALYFKYMKNFGVFSRFYMANCLFSMGESSQAINMAKLSYQCAVESNQPHSIGFGLIANVIVATMNRDFDDTCVWADKSIKYSTEQGFPEFIALSKICLAYAKMGINNDVNQLTIIEEGIDSWNKTGFRSWNTWFGSLYTNGLLQFGEYHKALVEIEKVIVNAKKYGEQQFLSPLYKIKGDLLRNTDHSKLADNCYSLAKSTAIEQDSVGWNNKLFTH